LLKINYIFKIIKTSGKLNEETALKVIKSNSFNFKIGKIIGGIKKVGHKIIAFKK